MTILPKDSSILVISVLKNSEAFIKKSAPSSLSFKTSERVTSPFFPLQKFHQQQSFF